ERHAEGDAQLVGDVLCLSHHGSRQRAGLWILTNTGERGARQGTDRVECHVAPELQPDLSAYILQHRRFQTRAREGISDPLHALGCASIGLTDGKPIPLDVLDDAVRYELGRRIDDATDHPIARNVLTDGACWIDTMHAGTGQLT